MIIFAFFSTKIIVITTALSPVTNVYIYSLSLFFFQMQLFNWVCYQAAQEAMRVCIVRENGQMSVSGAPEYSGVSLTSKLTAHRLNTYGIWPCGALF